MEPSARGEIGKDGDTLEWSKSEYGTLDIVGINEKLVHKAKSNLSNRFEMDSDAPDMLGPNSTFDLSHKHLEIPESHGIDSVEDYGFPSDKRIWNGVIESDKKPFPEVEDDGSFLEEQAIFAAAYGAEGNPVTGSRSHRRLHPELGTAFKTCTKDDSKLPIRDHFSNLPQGKAGVFISDFGSSLNADHLYDDEDEFEGPPDDVSAMQEYYESSLGEVTPDGTSISSSRPSETPTPNSGVHAMSDVLSQKYQPLESLEKLSSLPRRPSEGEQLHSSVSNHGYLDIPHPSTSQTSFDDHAMGHHAVQTLNAADDLSRNFSGGFENDVHQGNMGMEKKYNMDMRDAGASAISESFEFGNRGYRDMSKGGISSMDKPRPSRYESGAMVGVGPAPQRTSGRISNGPPPLIKMNYLAPPAEVKAGNWQDSSIEISSRLHNFATDESSGDSQVIYYPRSALDPHQGAYQPDCYDNFIDSGNNMHIQKPNKVKRLKRYKVSGSDTSLKLRFQRLS